MDMDYKRAYEDLLKKNTAINNKIQILEKTSKEAIERISKYVDQLHGEIDGAFETAENVIIEYFTNAVPKELLDEVLEELESLKPLKVQLEAVKKAQVRL